MHAAHVDCHYFISNRPFRSATAWADDRCSATLLHRDLKWDAALLTHALSWSYSHEQAVAWRFYHLDASAARRHRGAWWWFLYDDFWLSLHYMKSRNLHEMIASCGHWQPRKKIMTTLYQSIFTTMPISFDEIKRWAPGHWHAAYGSRHCISNSISSRNISSVTEIGEAASFRYRAEMWRHHAASYLPY